jgi:transposase
MSSLEDIILKGLGANKHPQVISKHRPKIAFKKYAAAVMWQRSARNILRDLGIDYDKEVERLANEQDSRINRTGKQGAER